MGTDHVTVGLVTDVFHDAGGPTRLRDRLADARRRDARLAVLPELPLHPWSPASRTPRDEDAEPPEGPRHRLLAEAAAAAGIAVVGGAIVTDPGDGRRHNVGLVFDDRGRLRGRYAKMHLPREPGFWETSHYEPGAGPVVPLRPGPGLPRVGLQICSDINRPEGGQRLAAAGAEAILVPRATEPGTWPRWRVVMRAAAITAAVWVVSVNRPAEPGLEVPIGGPSVVIDPEGGVVLETTDPVAVAVLDRGAVRRARRSYPGYLSRPA